MTATGNNFTVTAIPTQPPNDKYIPFVPLILIWGGGVFCLSKKYTWIALGSKAGLRAEMLATDRRDLVQRCETSNHNIAC
jgi:hypothetical protein